MKSMSMACINDTCDECTHATCSCPCHEPGYDPDRYLDGNTDDGWEET